jgi:hypothetical protein
MRPNLEVVNDIAEDVTNHRPKQQQNSDNHDSNENQDKRVLYEALTFFAGKK